MSIDRQRMPHGVSALYMPRLGQLLLALLLISATVVGAFDSMRMPHYNLLMSRQDSCTDSNNKRCDSPAQRFCCASSAECIPLNNGTEAICCPAGDDCSFIRTVACTDSNQQCGGSQCCPIGYDCDSQTTGQPGCKLQDRNKPASYILREQCAKINSGSGGSSSTSKSCLDLIAATKESCMEDCPKFPGKAILTGFFPGLAVGAIVMFLFGLWMRRRDQKALKVVGGPGPNTGNGSSRTGPQAINATTGFAAGRSSRKGTVASSQGRSLHRNNTLGSTEIDIGYDWKADDNFAARGRTGHPGQEEVLGGNSGAGNGITRVQSPLAYESELKSRQNVIAEEEIQSSGHSMGYSFRGQAVHSQPPSIKPNSITSSRRMKTPSPAPSNNSRKPVPPLPIAELPAMAGIISPTPYSRQASAAGQSTSYPHPYTTPPPSTRSPAPGPMSTPPPAAPLTHHHLLQHQRQASSSSPPPLQLPRAQSTYHSSQASSLASTNIEPDTGSDSDSGAVHQTNLAPPMKKKRRHRPPSDVISCITDGEHDDGLTTFSELAASGHIPRASARTTSVGGAGSAMVNGGDEERIAVDRGLPPPLPEGYVIGEGGKIRLR